MVVFSIYRIMTIFLYGLKEETHDSNSEELLTGINGIIKRRRRRRRRRRRIHIAVFRLISPPVCRCFKVAKIGPSVLRLEEGEKKMFPSISISDVMNKGGMRGGMVAKQPFFCSSLVKSESAWLRAGELILQAKQKVPVLHKQSQHGRANTRTT